MEDSVHTSWSDEGFGNAAEPGMSESWPTAIDDDPVVCPHAEGTVCNNIAPCIQGIESSDDSLALVVSNSNKRKYNSILDADVSDSVVYDRQTKRCRQDGVSEVEIATGDRVQNAECSPRFPTEIYETIIDYIAEKYHTRSWSNLARCALVCRAWVPRSQMRLFSTINLVPTFGVNDYGPLKIASFRDAARRKPFLLQYIKLFYMTHNSESPQQITILSSYRMPNLKQCSIFMLDLATVHPSLYRFPSSATSLQILSLNFCKTGDVNHLCRFLTSFRSLSIVIITWSDHNTLSSHDLPHLPFNRSKCSLQTLALELFPNLSAILNPFIKARPFVSHLRHLIVAYGARRASYISLRDITELLEHCSESLEELTVIWGCWFEYPIYSVSSVSPSMYRDVSEQDRKLFTDEVGCLDDILSRAMFCSFRRLRIKAEVTPIGFPKLNGVNVHVDFSDRHGMIPY